MSQTIATLSTEPFHTVRVRLEDQDYTLELRYNTRAQNYSLSIYDAEDTRLVSGLKVFTGVPLLGAYKHIAAIPRGELIPMTLGADQSPPKLGELGKGLRVELTYFTAQEFLDLITELGQELTA
jgi:uncharacterized protein DUF6983